MEVVIVNHVETHAEERYGTYLLETRPESHELYPGIETATLEYRDFIPPGQGSSLEKKRTVLVGIGFYRYDEHLLPGSGAERKKDTSGAKFSAAKLIVEDLGIQDDPIVAKMIDLLTNRDLHLGESAFELPHVIKKMGTVMTDFDTHLWAAQAFEAIHRRGTAFFDGPSLEAGALWDDILAVWLVTKHWGRNNSEISEKGAEFISKGIPVEILEKIGVQNLCETSCLTMELAKALYLDEDLALGELIRFTAKRKKKYSANALELHALVDAFHQAKYSASATWSWAETLLDALFICGMRFAEESAADFEKATKTKACYSKSPFGERQLRLVAGVSDSPGFSPFARSPHGNNAAIVIQKNKKGNVQIFTRANEEVDLTEVVQILRVEELRAEKRPIPDDLKSLSTEGAMLGCEKWYFFSTGRMALNGSRGKIAEPTLLPLERVTELIQIGLDNSRFEPNRAKQCRKGFCSDTDDRPCPWYPYKLERCWNVQQQTIQRRQERQRNNRNRQSASAV